ncbi:MAG: aldolase/citrate lyase family protein [Lentisphaeria bacterium]
MANIPRRSRVLDKLRAGQRVLCFKNNFSCIRASEIPAMAGFDCLWICQEHVPLDNSTMEMQILAAKAHDTDTIVRVQKGCYSDYILPLEADASGIMVPHLMSAEEARQIAHWTRFQPIGRRPLDGGNADGLFCRIPASQYTAFANENRLVIVQIEDPEPLSELDEICQVPGIDMIFFGPGDFSHSIGSVGELEHPEVDRVRRLVASTARKYGKYAGTVCSMDTMQTYFDLGYQFLNCGADVGALNLYCDNVVKKFRNCNENMGKLPLS